MLAKVVAHTTQMPKAVRLDAGYFSGVPVRELEELGTVTLIPPDRQTQRRQAQPPATRGRVPKDWDVADRRRRKRHTKRGRAH